MNLSMAKSPRNVVDITYYGNNPFSTMFNSVRFDKEKVFL